MKERIRYRSKIDEMVVRSGLSGLAVAREMGMTTNRMVSLRRAVDANISTDDMVACTAAIKRMGGYLHSDDADKLERLRFHLTEIFEILNLH